MKTGKVLLVAATLVFLSASSQAFAGKSQPRVVEVLSTASATLQEPISRGPLSAPRLTINKTQPTLELSLFTVLKCGEPLEHLAKNFTVSFRIDGVVVYTVPVSVSSYQQIPFSMTSILNGVSSGNHAIDVYVDAGAETVVFVSSTDTPTTLVANQY